MRDYDVFVSYKSEDVMTVRPVVDGLVAAGARVWFNEYEVLLAGWEQFQERIDEGTRRSSFGLAFTNDRYVGSPHCRNELELLLEHVGPEHIIEVFLPSEPGTHRDYPDLQRCRNVASNDPDEILEQVAARLGIRRLLRPKPRHLPYRDVGGGPRHAGARRRLTTYQGWLEGVPYLIDLDGWTVEMDPERNPGVLPEFKYAVPNPVLFANVSAGVDVSPEAQRLADTEGDREVFDYLRTYAPRHLGAVGATERGVHLLLKDGRSQMGLTYFTEKPPDRNGIWMRKISVIVPNHDLSLTGEFVFSFGLLGGEAQWRDYCLMAPLMDALAVSVTWGTSRPPSRARG